MASRIRLEFLRNLKIRPLGMAVSIGLGYQMMRYRQRQAYCASSYIYGGHFEGTKNYPKKNVLP
jgi:hypothetical protein